MPGFCPKCGDPVEFEKCEACGEVGVTTQVSSWKDPIKTAGTMVDGVSAGYVPSAFASAGRLQQSMGAPYVPPPPRRENGTALYDFMPQDKSTQLRLHKGDAVEIIRKDSDGWWFVVVDGEKGLVPGSYLKVDNPTPVESDPAIFSAREASNQRFNQWRQAAGEQKAGGGGGGAASGPSNGNGTNVGVVSSNGGERGPNHVDARANDAVEDKPTIVRKLKKCNACNETILGRTKSAKGEIYHEICLICRGCRESIEEEDDVTILKKKAYHAICAAEMVYCRTCDKEILGRAYKAGGASFHKLCMTCPQCQKSFEENGATLEDDILACHACVAEKKRKEEEAKAAARAAEEAKIAAAKAAEESRLAEKRAAEAREAERREAEERDAAQRAAEARAAEEQAAAAKAAEEKAAAAAQLAEEAALASQRESEQAAAMSSQRQSQLNGSFLDTSNLDEFDLDANVGGRQTNERMSDGTDLDFENDYGGSFISLNGERDSLRLSQVIDFGAVNAFNSASRANTDRMSTLSDFSTISETEDYDGARNGAGKLNHSTLEEEGVEDEDEEQEACGGCGSVLEGEAIGALNKYFHYECFKCGHCSKVIAEDDGYAEKDDMAFHQDCYQARFSKRCCRCTKVLKGKVVKALDSLYHPDCFVCFQCNSSLTESFFEHDSQAVCAQCKHIAITANAAPIPDDPVAISVGTVGYQFAAQDETQLTINPGQQVSILQKDDDGWWFVDLDGQRGYVPGSYLIEHPVAPKKSAKKAPKPQPKVEPIPEPVAPAKIPGLCECGTKNPDVARFCRSCGNNLMDVQGSHDNMMGRGVSQLRFGVGRLRGPRGVSNYSMWDRVRPSLWHPMATLEQSMLELDRMTSQMFSAPFHFAQTMAPRLHSDDDEFFKDLVAPSSGKEPTKHKDDHHKEKKAKSTKQPQAQPADQSYSSYSYSSSTILDENGHLVTSVRRRYEDSMGRLKAVHEREIDGKKVKTLWSRKQKDEEGDHQTLTEGGAQSVEEFEEEWKQTPFGQAAGQRQVDTRGETRANAKPEGVIQCEQEAERTTPGPDYDAAAKAPGKGATSEQAQGVTTEAQTRSRDDAIAQGAKTQEEETTPPPKYTPSGAPGYT